MPQLTPAVFLSLTIGYTALVTNGEGLWAWVRLTGQAPCLSRYSQSLWSPAGPLWFSFLSLQTLTSSFSCLVLRDLKLLDRKWVRTWCRMGNIGIKMREACWIDILRCIFLVTDSRIPNAKCNKSLLNYCHALQFEPAFTWKPQAFEAFTFAVQSYLCFQANLVAIRRELYKHHA